jgi:hypothetical protein
VRITARADTEAELRVIDTGIGIPEAELQHIGKRFHRITTEGGRSHEGTGIGNLFFILLHTYILFSSHHTLSSSCCYHRFQSSRLRNRTR